jgi:hypothetical protein
MRRANARGARMMNIAACTVATRQVELRRIAVAAILIACNGRNNSVAKHQGA